MGTEPVHEEQAGAGLRDAFARLYTPHRMAYIKGEGKEGCPFCDIPNLGDERGLIVARADKVYAVLNLYPYNSGHLMVVPFRHVADYTELDDAETAELASYTKQAMAVLRRERKQRLEAAEAYDKAGQDDRAARERADLPVIEEFLPAPLSEQELAALVNAVIADTGAETMKDMGRVMGLVSERSGGRVDGRVASALVRDRLSA